MATTLTMPSGGYVEKEPPAESEQANEAEKLLEGGEGEQAEAKAGEQDGIWEGEEEENESECGGDDDGTECDEKEGTEEVAEVKPEAKPEATVVAISGGGSRAEALSESIDEIGKAELECSLAEGVVNELKESLKEAKKEYDGAVIKLRKLCRAAKSDNSRPLLKSCESPPAVKPMVEYIPPADEAASDAVADAEAANADTGNADAWKLTPISELNLKPALATKLTENGITTVGKLENLRAEIANARGVWPKGIGTAKITQIEDAVVEWLTANRDQGLFGGGGATEAQAQDGSPAEETPAEETPEDEAAMLLVRCDIIDDGSSDEFPSEHAEGDKWHKDGAAARDRGLAIADCPYRPGAEQDDWLRGWLTADRAWAAAKSDVANSLVGVDEL